MITKAQLVEDNRQKSIENTAYLQHLNDLANGFKPQAVAHAEGRKKGERLYAELWRAGSAHGGIVILKQELENGELDARIHMLEDLNSSLRDNHSEHTLPLRIVMETLTRKRNEIAGYK
jgi:hypothetical protein